MVSENKKMYMLMNFMRGNWHNAFYVECKNCPYGKEKCDGFLLTADTEGVPVLCSVREFEKQTGEIVDKNECAAVIDRIAFETLYNRWLLWKVCDKNSCSLIQIKQ